jgi:hypothetical protein
MYAGFRATNADVLVASRYIPGGSTPNWPLKRKLLSRAACLLARPLSPIRDAASWLLSRSAAQDRAQRDIKAAASRFAWSWWLRGWPTRLWSCRTALTIVKRAKAR